jgi:hypothetical protein
LGASALALICSVVHPKAHSPHPGTATRSKLPSADPQREADREARRGRDWEAYKASYKAGYFAACRDLLLSHPGAVVYGEGGRSYGVDECYRTFPNDYEKTNPSDVLVPGFEKGAKAKGGLDACSAIVGFSGNDTVDARVRYGDGKTLPYDYCMNNYGGAF